ncbi:single-stranded DNA-binding protein [Streptomyces sp. TP-A0875]|uniref:single-stranded DNA-binding protein n=1 Tax=Streptomyces sp. TP-A0875 TaxID=552354 RepID=UPI00099DDA4C|nr:single-stranded DNA-binding protein [Streptomyces sp. TP-A0875]
MAGETVITVVGNLVDDPELRFTPSGHAVAKFRIASTPRTYDKSTNEWRDGDSLFLTVSAWRSLAENVAASLQRGHRVIARGQLKQRSYEDREGIKRTVYELDADDVGPSLQRATANVTKANRNGQQNTGGYGQQQSGYGAQQQPQSDPWANGQPAAGQWGNAVNEPPF